MGIQKINWIGSVWLICSLKFPSEDLCLQAIFYGDTRFNKCLNSCIHYSVNVQIGEP